MDKRFHTILMVASVNVAELIDLFVFIRMNQKRYLYFILLLFIYKICLLNLVRENVFYCVTNIEYNVMYLLWVRYLKKLTKILQVQIKM